ncbi:molybdopterin-dependent oxidoreductase [Actinocorallia libanotica]|uniref:molybdopterin-dependent oxidoreductase n=1 Tax=Actinocorallia libanotica TaxID=46162 RepID=UPI0031E007C8
MRTGRGRIRTAVGGLVAAVVAAGVAEPLAVLAGPRPGPLAAVGSVVVDGAPEGLKRLAIRSFGENDKQVLLACVVVVVLLLAGMLGLVARHRPARAMAGVCALGLVGAAAVLTRPGAALLDAVPVLVGALAGAVVLRTLSATRSVALPLNPSPVDALSAAPPDGVTAVGVSPAASRDGETAEDIAQESGHDREWVVGRRLFLAGTAGAFTVAAGGLSLGGVLRGRRSVEAARRAVRLPRPARPAAPLPAGVDLRLPGLSPFVTPNRDFYRVDTALVLPQVDPAAWTLRVHGLVERPLELSFDELLRRPLVEHDITLTCVSNEVGGPYVGHARWLGLPLAGLLREAGVRAGADQLLSRSADGWTCGTPLVSVLDGRQALLAVGMNGEPLPVAHGFPARLVVPGLYGYSSATKWVVDLEVTRFTDTEAYWVARGYAEDAPVKTLTRIDVPRPLRRLPSGRTVVAGVSWAQRRGIAAVEVRVDGGPWRQARLAPVPGTDTWRQWVLEWDATPGTHRIEARATDATGATQPPTRVPPFPDGATGWHSVVVTVI